MAGVEAIEQSTGTAPAAAIPRIVPSLRAAAVRRESCPTPIRSFPGSRPLLSASQRTKAAAIRPAISGVRFTGAPPSTSSATPRTSLPFCSFERDPMEFLLLLIPAF